MLYLIMRMILKMSKKKKKNKKSKGVDLICDEDKTRGEAILDIVRKEYKDNEPKIEYASNTKVLRDSKGRWLKGTPSPCPKGRSLRDKVINKWIELFGDDLRELNYELARMLFDKSSDTDKFKFEMIKYITDHCIGRAPQKIEAEIESKVLHVRVDLPDELKDAF